MVDCHMGKNMSRYHAFHPNHYHCYSVVELCCFSLTQHQKKL